MNLKLNKNVVACFIFLFAVVWAPLTGWSQEQGMPTTGDQLEISEEEVMVFAKAQDGVVELQREYATLASEVTDVDKRKEIVTEAHEKMIEVVEKEGLSVERYNIIASAAQSDTALQQRIIVASQKLK